MERKGEDIAVCCISNDKNRTFSLPWLQGVKIVHEIPEKFRKSSTIRLSLSIFTERKAANGNENYRAKLHIFLPDETGKKRWTYMFYISKHFEQCLHTGTNFDLEVPECGYFFTQFEYDDKMPLCEVEASLEIVWNDMVYVRDNFTKIVTLTTK